MGAVVDFPADRTAQGRKLKDRRDALRTARSGATEHALLRLYGRDAAEWARARLWCENGSDPKDKRGQELYVEIFEGGGR